MLITAKPINEVLSLVVPKGIVDMVLFESKAVLGEYFDQFKLQNMYSEVFLNFLHQ